MASIAICYASALRAARSKVMAYRVTFFAVRPDSSEVTVAVHQVDDAIISAYLGEPGLTIQAFRRAEPHLTIDGFRVEDASGMMILRHREGRTSSYGKT